MVYFSSLITTKKQLNQRSSFMRKLSQIWFEVQEVLFPFIEKEVEEPLTEKLKQLISTLELIRIEDMIRVPKYWQGQSPKNRRQIARAFMAKAVYNMDTTRELIDRLKISPVLRRICGWQKACEIPHESSFSRAFKEFSESGLAQGNLVSHLELNHWLTC